MIYEYRCEKCDSTFDVIKPASEMTREEKCNGCESPAKRMFLPKKLYFCNTAVEHAEFNPGLGCVVKNSKHRAEIAKQKGLVEIGNEKTEKIHKKIEKEREEKAKKAYDNIDLSDVL